MISNVVPPVTTGRGLGRTMPRRALEDAIRAEHPHLTRSQANKIARRNRTLEAALAEVVGSRRGFPTGIPQVAYRGHDATPQAAFKVMGGTA